MAGFILPTVGTHGAFTLSAPYDAYTAHGEVYTCQAVRTLGDYIANNEDPLHTIYLKFNLTEADFTADRDVDMYILTLQGTNGAWLYVPARYVLSYPLMDGVQYHGMALGISLGLHPVGKDFSALKDLLSNLIYDTLGTTPHISELETSGIQLLSKEDSEALLQARLINITQELSDRGRALKAEAQLATALQKIQILETYIKDHYVPPP
jgi:hypothetical protein